MGFFNKTVTINENGTIINIHNKKEALFMAEQWMRIANDSANLVNSTSNVDVFFNRYSLLIEELEKLSKLEKFHCFKQQQPSTNLKEILNKKEYTINDFITRFYDKTISEINSLKTDTAKSKRIESFYKNLHKYESMLSSAHLERIETLYLDLKNI